MSIVSCGDKALPRDIDVNVQINKPQIEETTDLTIVACLTSDSNVNFPPDAGRIRYYSTISAVEGDDDVPAGSDALKMAQDFFSQAPRALTVAIARVFTDPTNGFMEGNGLGADLAGFQAVADGSFAISIDGDPQDITGLNFTGIVAIEDVGVIIEAALQAIGSGGYTAATAEIIGGLLVITSGTTGETSAVSFLSPVDPASGTDISGAAFLNADNTSGGKTVDGYTPGDLESEAALIAEAALCNGRAIFGWTLDSTYRDTQEAIDFASNFMESQTFGLAGLQSNNLQAPDPGVTTDIGYILREAGLRRSFLVWTGDQNPEEFPEVAILSYMLHVDYAQTNSTVTAKFKNLNGITTVGITETELSVLNNKRYNTFTRVGNNARTFRDGVDSSPIWYMDSLINLDNYKEELQVALYNVFLREGKIPYTEVGQDKLYQAAYQISNRYVRNGTFADRRTEDSNRPDGTRTIPAFTIELQDLAFVTEAQRQAREGTPMQIDAYEAGAMHSLQVNVNAFT